MIQRETEGMTPPLRLYSLRKRGFAKVSYSSIFIQIEELEKSEEMVLKGGVFRQRKMRYVILVSVCERRVIKMKKFL